jgi:outer membrane murein-binding lipoprotein Lpp
MRSTKVGKIVAVMAVTSMLAGVVGTARAEQAAPMTPELAAKKEMVRKQQEQRLTNDKRKAAAEALKAERVKVYKAKEAAGLITPTDSEKK